GLNLLTGETGAGKSILIDALALLMGAKASPEVIRRGTEKAVVSCVFDGDNPAIARTLSENGLESSAEELILKREISAKSRVWINNQPATVAVLKQVAPELVSIHAQNETVLAFDPPARLKLLDTFAGINLARLEERFSTWRSLRLRIDELEHSEQDRLRLVDLWSFQKKEIDAVRPESGEDQRLETERRILMNAEKLYSAAMSVHDLLYESPTSTLSTLRAAARQMEELARFDNQFAESLTRMESARAEIEDISATARDYAESINASPERLAQIEERLAAVDRLKRKYGNTVDDVLAFAHNIGQKLNEVENRDEILRALRKELAVAAQNYLDEARAVSRHRAAAARKLEKLTEAEINELAMKAQFQIE
ncbi:MAG: DNA repair protein RecN, partial [Chthoniobacterales bacterium]